MMPSRSSSPSNPSAGGKAGFSSDGDGDSSKFPSLLRFSLRTHCALNTPSILPSTSVAWRLRSPNLLCLQRTHSLIAPLIFRSINICYVMPKKPKFPFPLVKVEVRAADRIAIVSMVSLEGKDSKAAVKFAGKYSRSSHLSQQFAFICCIHDLIAPPIIFNTQGLEFN
jgi:hypothetical protein